ncbi:MAG: tetratricopeptide repeat protein [Candidatus Lokiarchaeota archaeon]|nr:tetratricopeptide repeat protein [Candidatus Lokiarchaeota archaeon]
MVAIMENFFEKSKQFFEEGDINNTLEEFEKAIIHIDPIKEKSRNREYISFLEKILKHCRDNSLKEQEAFVLRSLGRTHSIFKRYVESLKYHEMSLKIQRSLGNKKDVAEGLVFLAEDLEISGNYSECIKMFTDAASIYHELGKLRKEKELKKEIARLNKFSKEMVEDEYILHKFHVDKF